MFFWVSWAYPGGKGAIARPLPRCQKYIFNKKTCHFFIFMPKSLLWRLIAVIQESRVPPPPQEEPPSKTNLWSMLCFPKILAVLNETSIGAIRDVQTDTDTDTTVTV